MSDYLDTWERVDTWTFRLTVPGGWIYRHKESLCFVPREEEPPPWTAPSFLLPNLTDTDGNPVTDADGIALRPIRKGEVLVLPLWQPKPSTGGTSPPIGDTHEADGASSARFADGTRATPQELPFPAPSRRGFTEGEIASMVAHKAVHFFAQSEVYPGECVCGLAREDHPA